MGKSASAATETATPPSPVTTALIAAASTHATPRGAERLATSTGAIGWAFRRSDWGVNGRKQGGYERGKRRGSDGAAAEATSTCWATALRVTDAVDRVLSEVATAGNRDEQCVGQTAGNRLSGHSQSVILGTQFRAEWSVTPVTARTAEPASAEAFIDAVTLEITATGGELPQPSVVLTATTAMAAAGGSCASAPVAHAEALAIAVNGVAVPAGIDTVALPGGVGSVTTGIEGTTSSTATARGMVVSLDDGSEIIGWGTGKYITEYGWKIEDSNVYFRVVDGGSSADEVLLDVHTHYLAWWGEPHFDSAPTAGDIRAHR